MIEINYPDFALMITEHASSPRGQTLPHLRRSGHAQPVTTENHGNSGPVPRALSLLTKCCQQTEPITPRGMASENAVTSAGDRRDTLVHRTGIGDPSSWREIFDRYFGPNRSNCTFYAVLFDVSERKAVKITSKPYGMRSQESGRTTTDDL